MEPQDNPVAHLTEYELGHLVEHLVEAGQTENVHRLLALETSMQRNAWYEAKEATGDVAGYISDITRAWQLARDSSALADSAQTGQCVGLQCRYALICSTLVSLSQQSVERGTSKSRLARSTLILDPRQRIEMLAEIMPSLDADDRSKARLLVTNAMSAETAPDSLRAHAIEHFISFFTSGELMRAYQVAHSMPNREFRVPLLSALVAHMPDSDHRQQILQELCDEVAHTQKPITLRIESTFRVWPRYPDVQYSWDTYVTKALPWIRLLSRDEQRAIFENILSRLEASAEETEAAHDLLEEYSHFPFVVDLVARLTPCLPEDLAKTAQVMALESLTRCERDDEIANGLLTLAPHLVPDLFGTAETIAKNIESKWVKAKVLSYFVQQRGNQDTEGLHRVVNNPRLFFLESFRDFSRTYGNPSLACWVVDLPIWMLDVLTTWFVAQFSGGLQWNTVFRPNLGILRDFLLSSGSQDPRDSTFTPTPESDDREPGLDLSDPISDESARYLTLVSLLTRLRGTYKSDIGQRFRKHLGLKKTLAWRLIWSCQQAFVSRYSKHVSRFSDTTGQRVPMPVAALGVLGNMALRRESFGSVARHDLGIMERLLALSIPGFDPQYPGEIGTQTLDRLVKVLPALTQDELDRILPESLDIFRDFQWHYGKLRLMLTLSCLETVRWQSVFERMVVVATQIEPDDSRALALYSLVPRLLTLSGNQALESLDTCLHALAKRQRSSLLTDLRFLAPLIEKPGGSGAIVEVARAIIDTGNWWP